MDHKAHQNLKMADKIVAPGEDIKPQIDLDEAVKLAEGLYGIQVDFAEELVGYDDKNYHFKISKPPNNPYITHVWPHGYVFKIMNSSDSKKLDYVAANGQMMMHLDNHEIRTPQPQKNREGKFYSLEKLPNNHKMAGRNSKEHIVRLLTYQEGTLMKDIEWSYALHYKVGRFAAQLDLILKEFSHPAYKEYSSLWMLKNLPNIKEYLFVINDVNKAALVQDVIKAFEDNVLSRFNTLQSGMIHGDIHDQNLLCSRDEEGVWHISAVLDLGDSQYSAHIVELALSAAYMMLQSGSLESGSQVVAGYCSVNPLPPWELSLLKVCVCARLCQSLVLGLYTHSLHPDNVYVLSTQSSGWSLLQTIWGTDSAQLYRLWTSGTGLKLDAGGDSSTGQPISEGAKLYEVDSKKN